MQRQLNNNALLFVSVKMTIVDLYPLVKDGSDCYTVILFPLVPNAMVDLVQQ